MEELTCSIKIGQKVPPTEIDVYMPAKKDFERIAFQDITGKGKWLILFFYPADYTFVCPTELADIQEIYPELVKEGAELISMSTDTHFVHYAWQSAEKLLVDITYPMGADPTHVVSKIFGVYDDATGLSLRGTFLIDPDGVLVASEVNFYSVGRNSDELLRKFKAFKHVRENPTNVCPAKWSPGAKTLTPGKDLVGNVADSLK
jgi:peroxiredoxin (alkyl hydroperoxide reductase subunit C)